MNPDGSNDFYHPGTVVTTIDSRGVGHKLVCGVDGEWHPARTATYVTSPRAPGGGVYTAMP